MKLVLDFIHRRSVTAGSPTFEPSRIDFGVPTLWKTSEEFEAEIVGVVWGGFEGPTSLSPHSRIGVDGYYLQFAFYGSMCTVDLLISHNLGSTFNWAKFIFYNTCQY